MIHRIFMDWCRPVAQAVSEYLIPRYTRERFVDLSGCLIIAPTREAGRRLREELARNCRDLNMALISASVETPARFTRPAAADPVADPLTTLAVWTGILLEINPSDYPGFLPVAPVRQDIQWAISTARTIQALRNQLADGMLRIADVAPKAGYGFEEQARWNDLELLEQLFMHYLEKLNLTDDCTAKIRAASNPELPGTINHIMIAAVPDPSLLMIEAIGKLAESTDISILIHAPSDEAGQFDEWGRPLSDQWTDRVIGIPDEDRNISLAADPPSQIGRVLEIISEESGVHAPSDMVVGVPDASLVPALKISLEQHGLPAFDPSGRPLSRHPVYQLIHHAVHLAFNGGYAHLRLMLRHPDCLEWLGSKTGIEPWKLLETMDDFHNRFLPASFADILETIERVKFSDREALDIPDAVCHAITAVLDILRIHRAPEAVHRFLNEIYSGIILGADDLDSEFFRAAAGHIMSCLSEMEVLLQRIPGISNHNAMLLLIERMKDISLTMDDPKARINLEGWLELHWNPAEICILTGMNEGFVPDGRLSDLFLPDSLRTKLGLRNDAMRFARDAYLMTALIEIRRSKGRVSFICGATGTGNEPLRPSRLLFLSPLEFLPARAGRLFREPQALHRSPPAEASLRLDVRPVEPGLFPSPENQIFSVTDFKAYLACPFRFYLTRLLGMNSRDDLKLEPDARDFGILIHEVMCDLHRDPSMRESRDEIDLAGFLCDRISERFRNRYGSRPSLPVRLQLESARQRVRAAAAVQSRIVSQGWRIEETEKSVTLLIDGTRVSGRIDRIDRHANGNIRIIEYKTREKPVNPLEAHVASPGRNPDADFARFEWNGKPRRWIDLQIPLYAGSLMPNPRSAPPETAYFNMPKSIEDTGIICWESLDASCILAARQCAGSIIDRVRRRIFWPPGDSGYDENLEAILGPNPESSILLDVLDGFMKGENR